MDKNFTDIILTIAGYLEIIIRHPNDCSDKELAGDVWSELADNLPDLIDFLRREYHNGPKIDPQIKDLRELLHSAEMVIFSYMLEHPGTITPGSDYYGVMGLCRRWHEWIDRYFPPDPSAAPAPAQVPIAPQQAAPAPAAPRAAGRPSQQGKTIKDCMLLQDDEQKDELLKKLHQLIDGKKGRAVALVILVCSAMGLMEKPGHAMMVKEFGDIGHRSGYNRYYNKGYRGYTNEETKGIEEHLAPFKVALNSNKSPQE